MGQETIVTLGFITALFVIGVVLFRRWQRISRIEPTEVREQLDVLSNAVKEVTSQAKQLLFTQAQQHRESEHFSATLKGHALEAQRATEMAQQVTAVARQHVTTQQQMVAMLENDHSRRFNNAGYIVFEIPEKEKGMFHDLLKGFEDYARLRGYAISFSIDNSFPDKVAFKFSFREGGISIKEMRKDLREYIRKVQTGESLDDLPVVIPPDEHNLLLVTMKNRISFLQHSYTLQKNTIEFYNDLFKKLPNQGFPTHPAQNFYLQAGDGNQASSYHAPNSPQSIQGQQNLLSGNTLDQSIYIAEAFNQRKEQVDALRTLQACLLEERERLDEKKVDDAEKWLKKIREELEEEQRPDPTRIQRWLETAKQTLKALSLTKEVNDAAKIVWEAFRVSF